MPSTNLHLFPYVLGRVSGGAFDAFEALNLTEASRTAAEMYRCRAALEAAKEKLCQALYETIPSVPDADVRAQLIQLKRDVYNARCVTPERLDLLLPHMASPVQDLLQQYGAVCRDRARLQHEGTTTYEREVAASRQRLRQLVRHEVLQKGLLLSSRSLLEAIPDYVRKGESRLGRRTLKTEQGLVKYLSRIYAKTSPYSTFTALGILPVGSPTDPADAGPEQACIFNTEAPEPLTVVSHIRLNNHLFKYIRALVTHYPAIYRRLRLRPNPTMIRENGCYLFLTNSHNVESFQRIQADPVIDLFLTLAEEVAGGIVYQDLVRTLIKEHAIDAAEDELEAYINQLLTYGLLEFNVGVSGMDPDWDATFGATFAPLAEAVPLVGAVLTMLKELRKQARQYGQAPTPERSRILDAAFERFKAVCLRLHGAAGLPEEERTPPQARQRSKPAPAVAETRAQEQDATHTFRRQSHTAFRFQAEQMFYEDVSGEGLPSLNENVLAGLATRLQGLLQHCNVYGVLLDERDKMLRFFVSKYGEAAQVSLLEFYEAYYREVKKPDAERNKEAAAQRPQKPQQAGLAEDQPLRGAAGAVRQQQRNRWQQRFSEILAASAVGPSQTIRLTQEQLQTASASVLPPAGGASSNACFVQLFAEPGPDGDLRWLGVVNATFPGFGRMFSRFLHLFDVSVTDQLLVMNRALVPGALMLEGTDASYFNANLHPPIMPYEVQTPNGHNSLPEAQQIPVTQLAIRVEAARLVLIHEPSGKPVYVFNLGFQSSQGRSKLFQLLEHFCLGDGLSHYPLLRGLDHYSEKQEQQENDGAPGDRIRVRPRVVYEDHLILRRKTWLVPYALLPHQESNEQAWSYFARLNAWRLRHGIPDEVFVVVTPRIVAGGPAALDEAARQRLGRDDYKPQYISFNNPFLVNLFAKLVMKVPDVMRIEEMLPNSTHLLKLGGRRYVTEFVVQWYQGLPNAPGAPAEAAAMQGAALADAGVLA